MARPRLKIDPQQVEALAALHCTNVEIAAFFGCHVDTVRDRFSTELAKGREKGKIKLRRLQWQSAENGNVTMQIFLGKQYLGQSDRTTLETVNGDTDRPFEEMSDEELLKIRDESKRAKK